MGKSLIIKGADFLNNAVEPKFILKVVNTYGGSYFDSNGKVTVHGGGGTYSDIIVYRVIPGMTYVLHGPTPNKAAYGIMVKMDSPYAIVGTSYPIIDGPAIGKPDSYTYTFVAPSSYIGLTDQGNQLGTHSYIALPNT